MMSSHSDSFVASGNSPTPGPDFIVENHVSISLLDPLPPAANSWVDEHLPHDCTGFGGGIVVEHRYIANIASATMGWWSHETREICQLDSPSFTPPHPDSQER